MIPVKKRRWLILSYYSNVDGLACSHHVDDRLPCFQRLGVEFTILSGIVGRRSNRWPHMRAPGVSPSLIKHELRKWVWREPRGAGARNFIRNLVFMPLLPLYALESMLLRWDPTWWWAVSALPLGAWQLWRKQCTTIYSTGGPNGAHLAGLILSRLFGCPWIAELQDPLIHSYGSKGRFEHRLLLWLERQIFRHATQVVFLTENALLVARERTGIMEKGVAIHAGAAQPASSPPPKRSDKHQRMVMVHGGTLSGVRSPLPFFNALQFCLEKNPELQTALRVDLYGGLSEPYRQALTAFPFRDVLFWRGCVPRETALAGMREADVLLLIQGADDVSIETIPSKTYEYLHIGKPILGMVHRNDELRGILAKFGHSAFEISDTEGIARALKRLHLRWQSGIFEPPKESPYTVAHATKRLIDCAFSWER